MEKVKKSLIINLIIVLLVTVGCFLTFNGIRFMSNSTIYDVNGLSMFKFFTIDSNILIGIGSFVFIIYEILLMKNKTNKIPNFVFILKSSGVVSVVLTFVVTLFFLAPTSKSGFFSLYLNSNLFFHFIIPILSVISFVFYEGFESKSINILHSTIPMMIYSLFYLINVLLNTNGSVITTQYDFYNFLGGNIYRALYVMPIIFLITYIMSYIILKINKNILNN